MKADKLTVLGANLIKLLDNLDKEKSKSNKKMLLRIHELEDKIKSFKKLKKLIS